MLILKRRAAEEVVLDDQTRVTVVSMSADRVKLKVTVPIGVRVQRLHTPESLDCEAVLVPDLDTVVP